MQVQIVAQDSSGHHRIVPVLLLERGKLIIGRLVDDHMIFDPAHLALAGLGLEEAASMLDDFKRLSIRHQGDAVRYSGNPVPQVGLLRHHVDHLGLGALAQAGASTQRGHHSDADCRAGKETRAGAAEERQSSEHMRGGVSLSALEHFCYWCHRGNWTETHSSLSSPRNAVQGNSSGVVQPLKRNSRSAAKDAALMSAGMHFQLS